MSSITILRRQKETKELLDFPEDKIPWEALLVLIKSTRKMITYLYNSMDPKGVIIRLRHCRMYGPCWLADNWNRKQVKSSAAEEAEGNGPWVDLHRTCRHPHMKSIIFFPTSDTQTINIAYIYVWVCLLWGKEKKNLKASKAHVWCGTLCIICVFLFI